MGYRGILYMHNQGSKNWFQPYVYIMHVYIMPIVYVYALVCSH